MLSLTLVISRQPSVSTTDLTFHVPGHGLFPSCTAQRLVFAAGEQGWCVLSDAISRSQHISILSRL